MNSWWWPCTFLVPMAIGLAALVGGCGAPPPVPPAAPGSAEVQHVPQFPEADTFCLAPPGSGLRAWVAQNGHRREFEGVTDVSQLPPGNPWRCP